MKESKITTNGVEAQYEEGRPLTISGYIQHYGVRNLNGQTDERGCYAAWIADFKAGNVTLPLVLEHEQGRGEDIIGRFISVEDREDGIYGVAEVVSTPYIDAEIVPRIRAGIWPAFSTCLLVQEWEDEPHGFVVTRGYLRHVSLVCTPADTGAKVMIANELTFNTKEMKTNKTQMLKTLRNALATDISETLREAVEAAISQLEASDVEHTLQEAIEAVKTSIEGLASVEQVEAVENSLRAMITANATTRGDYLNSKQAVTDFVISLKNNRGDGLGAGREFAARCKANGVTDADGVLLPAPILVKITDALRDSWLWSKLRHTGLKSLKVGLTALGTDYGDDARAGAHKPGTAKVEQELTLAGRTLTTQGVYKLISIPWEMVEQSEEDVLIEYVTDELVRSLVAELERAVLVGDGRSVGDDRHITSIIPIATDAGCSTLETFDPANMLDGVINGIARMASGGRKLLVANAATLIKLRRRVYAAGGTPTFISHEQLAAEIGVAEVLEAPAYVDDNMVIVFDADSYLTVGNRKDTVYAYDIRTNTHVYEVRQMVGGGLTRLGSGLVLVAEGTRSAKQAATK